MCGIFGLIDNNNLIVKNKKIPRYIKAILY